MSAIPNTPANTDSKDDFERRILDALPISAIITRISDGTILFANQASASMLGMPDVSALLGKPVPDFYWEPAERQIVLEQFRAQGGLENYQLRIRRVDNSMLWAAISLRSFRFGGETAILSTITDMSERKLADEKLIESDERYRRLSAATIEGVVIHDKGLLIDANPTFASMFGYELDEVIGMNALDFLTPETREITAQNIRTGYEKPYDVEGLRKDGSTFPVEITGKAIPYKGHTVRVTALRDISERKQVEAELRQNELRLSNAMRLARMGYWDFDMSTQKFIFNEHYYNTFHDTTTKEMGGNQMSPEEFTQRFVPPEEAPIVGEGIQEAIQTNDPNFQKQFETRNYTAKGEIRWVSVWLSVEKDEQGRTVKLHGVNQDITERKLLEAQVRQEFERRGYQVQVSTEISQEVAAASELSDLFERVVTLTKERLGYYHTQLLRYDPAQDAVVLINGYGEIGQKMLAGEHKMPLGDGLIGTAAANGETLLRSTLADDPDWHPNPLLPDTQGEIAVPIKWQDTVLGVLDVQSDKAGALTEDDRLLLEGLCGQIAIAMHSAELVETIRQNEARLAEALRTARLANWEYDVEKDIFTFNDQFYSIFHTTAEKVGGYQLSSARYAELFVHPDDMGLVGSEIEKSLSSTERVYNTTLDHRIVYQDGGIGYITVKVTVERDDAGKVIRYYGANQDITERKQTEEALRRSEQLMRTVIDSTPDWIFIKDQGHRYQLANKGYADALHISPENFIGKDDLDLGFPEELVKGNPEKGIRGFWTDDRLVMDNNETLVTPDDPATIDGVVHTFDTIKVPLRDADGKAWGVLAFARDITERKQAEDALRESELRYQQILDAITDMVLVKGEKSRIVWANKAFRDYYGMTNEQLRDMIDAEFSEPDYTLQYVRDDAHVFESGEILHIPEEPVTRHDGIVRPFETVKAPIRDLSGKTVMTVGVSRDITERKQERERIEHLVEERTVQLNVAREQFENIINFLPDATLVIDKDRNVIAWNQAIEEMTGIPAAEILGKGDYAYTVPFYGDRRPMMIDFALSPGEAVPERYTAVGETRHRLSGEIYVPMVYGGKGAHLYATAAALYDKEGNIMGAVESIRDITERKKLEDEIQELFERRGYQVQISTEIAQEIATASELSDLFERVVTLTKERLGYYHTQLLRYDPVQDAVVLINGYGEIGQKMLAGEHKMPLGEGLIGAAAANGETVLRSTLADDPDWHPNPLLPETQGEIAVPIKWQDTVLGVLDVQSDKAGAISEDDRLLLEGLCGQIGIAIHNAELVETVRESELRYQQILDAITDMVLVKGEKSRIVWANKAFRDYYGMTNEQLRDMIDAPFSEPDYTLQYVRDDAHVFENGEILHIPEEPVTRYDGIVRMFETVKAPIRDLSGKIVMTVGVSRDITERIKEQESMAERLEEINRLYSMMSREGWKSYRETTELPEGFVFDQAGVRPVEKDAVINEHLSNTPIQVLGGEVVGTLSVADASQAPMSLEDEIFLQQVSEQIALALESARLFEQTQSALAQSEKLFEASRRLAQVADLQELVKTAVDLFNIPIINGAELDMFSYDAADDLESITVVANWWNGTGTAPGVIGTRFSKGMFSAVKLFLTSTPVFISDALNSERVDAAMLRIIQAFNIRAATFLPLFVGTHQIGVLVMHAEEPHNFTEEETRLFSGLAPLIATVLENRRQFERAQKQAERESMLNIISQKIQSATTVDAVLQIAARELGHALGAPMTIAQLSMKDKK